MPISPNILGIRANTDTLQIANPVFIATESNESASEYPESSRHLEIQDGHH